MIVDDAESGRTAGWSAREKILFCIAAILLAVAAIVTGLYVSSAVPSDAAAKVNDRYLHEGDLAAYIQQYRTGSGLTDDVDFAKALLASSYNVGTFRQSCINQLALNMLVDERAAELGVEPGQDAVDALYAQTKSDFAMESDDIWEATLADQGMSEEGIRSQLASRLAQKAVFEADVKRRDATDDQVMAYVSDTKAGQTLRHSYRILFTGESQWTRAQECYEELKRIGEVTPEKFSALAVKYSDDDDVKSNGGAYGWSDAQDMAEEYREILDGLAQGEFAEPATIDSEDAAVIAYCDEVFEFPAEDKIGSLKKDDIPEDLWTYLAAEESDELWATDCNAYLANLLANAKITYYPIPDGAAYDVDMTLAVEDGE